MEYLIIYDNTGRIYYQVSGDVVDPIGLNFMRIEIPEGKYLKSVDTSVTPHKPVYEDSPIDTIKDLYEKLAILESGTNDKVTENTSLNLMVLEAMAEVYETVLPFLP
jgi:hypothetical protein